MIHGITAASKGLPDYKMAVIQHETYINALISLGLEVTSLKPDSRFPDSTFVEDVALCTNEAVVITFPGEKTRQGEQVEIEKVLGTFYDQIEHIDAPGTLEAGDVMMAGHHFFIGISERTNHEGADQLIRILEKYDMSGEKIDGGLSCLSLRF